MERAIIEFHQDKVGDWVADLECGHTQHVRHNPPMVDRKWVLSIKGREKYIGIKINCKLCDEILNQEDNIEDYLSKQKQIRIAEATKAACLKAAIEAYTDAKMRGVCQEGAWDLAVDSIKTLDLEQVLESLPD